MSKLSRDHQCTAVQTATTISIVSKEKVFLSLCLVRACSFRLFELFPVLLAIAVTWVYAIIVTEAGGYDGYDEKSNFYQYCRTDQSSVLRDSSWFRWPYPGQWGGPIFTWSAVLTMLAGALSAMVESVSPHSPPAACLCRCFADSAC